MAIQAQVPVPTQTAPPATGADLLAFLSGKPIDVRVVGFTVDGLTQLQLGKGIIKLALPTNFPVGTVLTLQIKGGQLLVLPQTSGGNAALPGSSVPLPIAATPIPVAPPLMPGAPVNTAGPKPAMPAMPTVANGPGQGTVAPPMQNGANPSAGAAGPAMQVPVSPASALQAQLQASILPGRPLGPPVNPDLPAGQQGQPAPSQGVPTQKGTAALQGSATLQGQPVPQGLPPAPTGALLPMPAADVATAPLAGMSQASNAPPKLDGMGALLANLAVFEGRLAEMPAPVALAARQFLGQQINLAKGRLTGERLQQAIAAAGILAGEADEAAGSGARLAVAGATDQLKASLMQLQRALVGWVGQERSAGAPVARPGPPSRPGGPRAGRLELLPLPEEDGPEETGRKLLEHTDTALARFRPGHAGSAEPLNRPDPAQAAPRSEWAGQVPMFLGQEAGLAQFQISRDGGSAGAPETRSWQVRFAINFSVIGEVGAHVLLRGKRASVTLWAERDDTAEALDGMLPELTDAFAAAGLEAGSIQCRHGVPRAVPVATGGLVDSVR